MLQLRYILVRLNYVWKQRYNYVSVLLVILTYFYYVTVTLFICLLYLHFFMTLELRYVLARLNYVLKLRHKTVIFKLHLFVTKK